MKTFPVTSKDSRNKVTAASPTSLIGQICPFEWVSIEDETLGKITIYKESIDDLPRMDPNRQNSYLAVCGPVTARVPPTMNVAELVSRMHPPDEIEHSRGVVSWLREKLSL